MIATIVPLVLLALAAVMLGLAIRVNRRTTLRTRGALDECPDAPRTALPHPASGRRVGDLDIAALASRIRQSRRRLGARYELERSLAALDVDAWHVERDMVLETVTLPFTIFGPTGVFILAAGDGWDAADLDVLRGSELALGALLPGYAGAVHGAVIVADLADDDWFGSDQAGGWIVGLSHVAAWLASFDGPGFAGGDLSALRAALLSAPASAEHLPHA